MQDPTQPLAPDMQQEKQENNRNPSWFKPGESGNPNGRPKKGYSVTEHVRELLENKPDTMNEIVTKIIEAAKAGDIAAVKIVWAYMDGQPVQPTELKHEGSMEIITRRSPTKPK